MNSKMEASEQVKEYLTKIGVLFNTHSHPPVYTCEEAEKYNADIRGIHSKNLVIKGKKTGNFYMAIIPAAKKLNLKELKAKMGEEFRFAEEGDLEKLLGIKTGAVSPFNLINDKEAKVGLLLDEEVMSSEYVSFHPNVNTETLELTSTDFKKYLASLKNKIEYI